MLLVEGLLGLIAFLLGAALFSFMNVVAWRLPRGKNPLTGRSFCPQCGAALTAGASLQQIGMQETTAGNAGFITCLYVILVPLFGAFLGNRTPLGTLLARLQWSVGEASIETAQERRSAATLSALLREVTGEALPIDALFDWLSGVPTLAAGWQADLQQLDEGRLSATRTQPPPAAMLRILLNP